MGKDKGPEPLDLFSYEPPDDDPPEDTPAVPVEPYTGDSLSEARERLMAARDIGVTCPCCDQMAKRYKRSLCKTQIEYLMALMRLQLQKPAQHWYHWREFGVDGHDYRKARHWGLLEQKSGTDGEDKKNSGYWRLTQKGLDFLRGRTTIPEHCYTYDNHIEGFGGEQVTVVDCLGNDFSYQELMNGMPAEGEPRPFERIDH